MTQHSFEFELPHSLIEDFQRDGAVCVRQLFTADEVALLERGIERNLATPSERAKVASSPDDPGWFFVIKERPGEPRFGLDDDAPAALQVWNDLSWPVIQPKPAGSHIEIATAPAALSVTNPGADDEKYPQYLDDRNVQWNRNTISSAELAYMTFQAPVLMAVHAHEMLPET